MRVSRSKLTALLNRLAEQQGGTITIGHPSDVVGDLLQVDLTEHEDCEVELLADRDTYADRRADAGMEYPDVVCDDLPAPADYRNVFVASGLLEPANLNDLQDFLDRYGDPDLMAGHAPAFVGIDTNLLPWRLDRVLGLRDPDAGIGYVNGFVLATGIRDELEWDHKCTETRPFEEAFGPEFEEYWNQPLGSVRIGRLGLLTYRAIRDIEQADEIESDRGDEAIIDAYDTYRNEKHCELLLLSNDRNFVERARAHRLLGQRVDLPDEIPDRLEGSWREIERLVYLLAILFGIVELSGATVYGVWRGKDELDWQRERLRVDLWSPYVEEALERDLAIVDAYEAD